METVESEIHGSQPTEEWRAVIGWEGLYEVSSFGRLRSLDKWTRTRSKHGTESKQFRPGRILRTYKINSGYDCVKLHANGSKESFLVHRLVAEAFLDNPHRRAEVNHIDGNKSHNWLSNLEWVSRSENKTHAFRLGLRKNSGRGLSALSDADIVIIHALWMSGQITQRELAKSWGVSEHTIYAITLQRHGRDLPVATAKWEDRPHRPNKRDKTTPKAARPGWIGGKSRRKSA